MTEYILIAIFIFGVSLTLSLWLLLEESRFMRERSIKKRLLYISASTAQGEEKIKLYRERVLEDANLFMRLSYNMASARKLARLLHTAGVQVSPLLFVFLCLTAGLAAAGTAGYLFKDPGIALLTGAVFLVAPFLYLKVRLRAIHAKFNEQLPEALDLLSRAMRAGHALTSGLAMVSEEMGQPIKDEFATVVDEINFGLSFKEAFYDMCERMPLTDLKFFSVAMLIQRETGGNITEIMDNISRLIRERMQFHQQVKTLTAEGRLSGLILLAMPVVMFIYLYAVNFEYISLLWRDPVGPYMLGGGIISQIIGAIVIKKMVAIEI
jgi:tight adherence protein B